jgi:hypothetical protein
VSKFQPRGCSGESQACNGAQAAELFEVTNPYYRDPPLFCPVIADPAWYIGVAQKFCCHYLRQLIIENCRAVPCEQLYDYMDAAASSGACSTAPGCITLGFQADLSMVGQLFDRLKTKFRKCLQRAPTTPDTLDAPAVEIRPTNCTKQMVEVDKGFCKGYPLGWSACTDNEACGLEVVSEVGEVFTAEFCTAVLQSLCSAVGGRPRCQSSCSFMCEMLIGNVWPPQCERKTDCERPSMAPSASDQVPPMCCGSLRRTILANCERVDETLLDAHMASVTAEGIPSSDLSTDALEPVRKEESCNASDCIDVPVCSIVQFPIKYMKDEVFCYMLQGKYFMNQELIQDPVAWDRAMALSYKKVPSDVFMKQNAGCEIAYKQWMCAFHARPCARTQEPTHLCLDFCVKFMQCNASIETLMANLRATESTTQSLGEQEEIQSHSIFNSNKQYIRPSGDNLNHVGQRTLPTIRSWVGSKGGVPTHHGRHEY